VKLLLLLLQCKRKQPQRHKGTKINHKGIWTQNEHLPTENFVGLRVLET